MPSSRIRLNDAELAAVARYHFGISEAPVLPQAAEFEDAQGVPVATLIGGRLDVLDMPRWKRPRRCRNV
jgi:sulfate adenylyltransferase